MGLEIGAIGQDLGNSMIGNVPKAILCVRDFKKMQHTEDITTGINAVNKLQTAMMKKIENTLKGVVSTKASATLSSFSGDDGSSILSANGYLGLEVQYNPSSIHFDSQAGSQVSYSGGTMGSAANNQVVQVVQPVSTTMSLQLIFDDVNVYDSFMLTDMMPTVGNTVSAASDIAKKVNGKKYSVQPQVDGLVSLLTMDETRQVIFFWSRMCFRGEVTSVNSSYTMFNTSGNPVRGVVNLTIRQGDETIYKYDEKYWNDAFDRQFGSSMTDDISGQAGKFKQITNNNILNLNI